MNAQGTINNINWHQAFAEIILISVGVGLALAADSWLDNRGERQEEHQYLVAIRSDIEKTRNNLEDTVRQTEHSNRLTLRFIQMLQGPMNELTDEELIANIQNTFFMYWPIGVFGTYQDMVSSGDLRLIQNAKIRRALAKFESDWTQELVTVVDEGFAQWNQMQAPFLVSNLNMTSTHLRDYRGVSMPENFTFKPIDREKLWSQEFENIQVVAVVNNVDLIETAQQMIVDANSVLAMIDEELGQ